MNPLEPTTRGMESEGPTATIDCLRSVGKIRTRGILDLSMSYITCYNP